MKPKKLFAVSDIAVAGSLASFVPLVVVLLTQAAACSSSSSLDPTGLPPQADAGGGSDTGAVADTAIAAYDAQGTPLVKCGTMTCPRGDICVQDNSDAGPGYHCKGFPAACAGTLSCACASALCDPGAPCQSANAMTLLCGP